LILANLATPQDYGALGNNTHDDTSAINAALAAQPLGGVVYLPPGQYLTTAPIMIPPQVRLMGLHSSHIDSTVCAIAPAVSFSGAAVILMVDQATGGYSVVSNQQSIFDITLDGSNLTGSTIDGIQAQGYVHGVILQDVQIRSMPNHGIAIVSNGSGIAYSWRGTRIAANACAGPGFSVGMTDCTWIDAEAIGNTGNGFNLSGQPSNSQFIGCRAEYNGGSGFSFSGAWTGGGGNGGCILTGCTTDGNVKNGISVTATGDSPLIINGGYLRRDGSNGTSGGAGYAGINIAAATIPVLIDQVAVLTGTANAGGVNSPQYGISVTASSANTVVQGGILYGNTAAWNDDGSNTNLLRGPNVIERIGTQSSYTTAFNGMQVSDTGLAMAGHALGVPTPNDHGLIAWTCDPRMAAGSSGDTAMAAGVIYLDAFFAPSPRTATKIYWGTQVAGANLTAGQCYLYVISMATGLVVASVDVTTALLAAAGAQTSTISATALYGGYWVGLVQNGTTPTPAKLWRSANSLNNGTLANLGIATAALKTCAMNGSGLTTLQTGITTSANTSASPAYTHLYGIGP